MAELSLPIYQALMDYRRGDQIRMHMPGHKRGIGLPRHLPYYWHEIAALDITEIPIADDLYQPSGIIKESQQALADLYGAEDSYYLVNGASVGLMAALMAIAPAAGQAKRRVLLPRRAHRSLWHGCILADLWPVTTEELVDDETGLLMPLATESLEQTLQANPDLCAVVLLHPDYYGLCGDLQEAVALCHRYGLPVLVDEAHGTHLRFLPNPIHDGLQCGADVVVQSPHKTASSLTQTAWMHRQGTLVSADRLHASLRLLHTSSPSFVLLASLEASWYQLATEGEEVYQTVVGVRQEIAKGLEATRPYSVLSERSFAHGYSVLAVDPCKLYLRARPMNMTGFVLADIVRSAGLEPELANAEGVLFLFGPGDGWVNRRIAVKRFASLPIDTNEAEPLPRYDIAFPVLERALSPRDAWMLPSMEVQLDNATARIAAETITPYPPGIPIVTPGERFSCEVIDIITRLLDHGAHVAGIDNSLRRVKVVMSDA